MFANIQVGLLAKACCPRRGFASKTQEFHKGTSFFTPDYALGKMERVEKLLRVFPYTLKPFSLF